MNKCGILFPKWGPTPKDEHGCIKPEAHNDAHVFIDENGQHIEWEDDYECTCGCWDNEYEDESCKVYNILKYTEP